MIIMNEPCFALNRIFNVLAQESNSPQEDMSIYQDMLFWLRANPSSLIHHNATFLVENQQIPILIYVVWPGWGSSQWPSTLERSTLTITPPRQSHVVSRQFHKTNHMHNKLGPPRFNSFRDIELKNIHCHPRK